MPIRLSVIVPVYNAAPYIEKCLESLFSQTLPDIEYIIINDCTPDNSMEVVLSVLAKYPDKRACCKIISHKINRGIAFTREEGHSLAQGEFVTHCDSDDWVDADFYHTLYDTAVKHDADMAVGDFMYEHIDRKDISDFPDIMKWDDFYRHRYVHLSFANRLIRRSLIVDHGLHFYEGVNFSEDYGVIFRCYFYSRFNVKIKENTYYHYNRQNVNQATKKIYSRDFLAQRRKCLSLLSDFLSDKSVDPLMCQSLNDEKRSVKEGYLLAMPMDLKCWRRAFPEVTPFVVNDKNLSAAYRAAWWLGQHVNENILKAYLSMSR